MSSSSPSEFTASTRFEIRRQVGIGGMGVVYEAYDRHREEVVAIKKIRHLNSEGIYRLKKEFRALADLTHPNLVALYELFSGEDGYFFSMEYVAGVDFLTYVRGTTDRAGDIGTHKSESMSTVEGDQPPPPQGGMQDVLPDELATTEQVLPQLSEAQTQRLRWALAQLRDGVECLHRVNRLHCDIKPSNILVTPAGRLVLLDCGLTMDSGGDSNASGQRIAGTFPYMSPEQAEARRLSPASDWYAVGVIVYEAIVGIRPFVGTVFEVVLAKREREPVRPSLRISAVPNDLDDLCMRLLDRNPQTRASGRDIADYNQAAEPDPIGMTAPDMGARSLFVGRGQELGMLQAAFYQISAGQAVVAFVKGESGLGKTALVNHFLDDVRAVRNTVVLSGRCYERESVPFKALDDLMDELAKYLMRLPAIEAVQLLPRDVSILAKLFPGLLRVNAVANAPHRERTPLDQKELRLKAFAALRELLGRISDRANLVLAIDDLQWGDLDGVELLNNLLCPPDQPAMLLIVSYRSESENDSIIASLRRSPQIEMTGVSVRQIDLSPLDATEAKELALAFAKDSSEDAACFAEAVARESGGNPYFVDALARQWHLQTGGNVPSHLSTNVNLDEVVWKWVASLSTTQRILVEIVSVAGHPLREAELLEVTANHRDVRDALRGLCTDRLLKTSSGSYGENFETFHDRIRHAVVAHLSRDRVSECHRVIASALEASGTADPATVAAHLIGAGDRQKASSFYMRAADQAASAYAFDLAAKYYRLVMEFSPVDIDRFGLRHKLADALANAGLHADAAKEYLVLADRSNGEDAINLRRLAAMHLLISGRIQEGLTVLELVVKSVGLKMPATVQRAVVSLLYHRLQLKLRGLNFRESDVHSLSALVRSRVSVCRSAGYGLFWLDTVRAIDFRTQHLIFALQSGDAAEVAVALAWEAVGLAVAGTRMKQRSDELIKRAECLANSLGNPQVTANVTVACGIARNMLGDCTEAMDRIDRAISIFQNECIGAFYERTLAEGAALWALSFAGKISEIRHRIPAYFAEGQKRNDIHRLVHVANLVLLPLADDDPQLAERELERRLKLISEETVGLPHLLAYYGQMQIHLYRGDGAAALADDQRRFPAIASTVNYFQTARLLRRYALGCAHIVCSAQQPQLSKHLRMAERCVREIERERAPLGNLFALLLRTGIASLEHKQAKSVASKRSLIIANLQRACEQFESLNMPIYAAAAKWRLGEFVENSRGAYWMKSACDWMTSQRIISPQRMTALFIPGDFTG